MTSTTIQPPLIIAPPRASSPKRPAFRFRKRYLVVLLLLCVPVLCAFGITGYFRLSSDTDALRNSFMTAAPGQWQKKFAAHAGWMTFALVRSIGQLLPLPVEPRAALNAVQGAEVGIYELHQPPGSANPSAILLRADEAMTGRGWVRIVAVAHEHELVAIYIPAKGVSSKRMTCCLAVLKDRELVVVSARANLDPLLDLAARKLASNHPWRSASSHFAVPARIPPAAKRSLFPYS
jgi:hypothetical protein